MMCKGRNKNLINKRNKKLVEKYHYLSVKKNIPFDDVLSMLSEMFFLSEKRIEFILKENNDYINELICKSCKQ